MSERHHCTTLPLGAALVVTACHLALAGRYDLFRDELYFIVCGQHPAFGYVDQPPCVPLMAAFLYALGHGALALRVPTALAAGALVWLSMRFARLLDGGRIAEWLAGLACAIAPMLMGLESTLNTSSFEPLAWTAVAYLMTRAIRERRDAFLILAGAVAGLALEIKYAMPFWIVGLMLGLLATPERSLLRRPAFWIGAIGAVAIALPSAIWQAANGFPFLGLLAAAKGKNADIAALPFFSNQISVMNPALLPLWLAGLVAPFLSRRLAPVRFLVIAALVVVAIVRLGHGKDYYLAPLYPSLFVIGAVALAPLAVRSWGRILLGLGTSAAIMLSLLAAPLALPLLPPAALVAYMHRTGIAPQLQERDFKGTVLPQLFADQVGWHDFVDEVEAAWFTLRADTRETTSIVASNYGEAAALDLYGTDLPPALSGHNQYFLWGLRDQHPSNLLLILTDPDALKSVCRQVVPLGETWSRYAMPFENRRKIVLCRRLVRPLGTFWNRLRNFS